MTKRTFVLALFLALGTLAARGGEPPAWEELSNEDGITVWSRDIPDSDVVAFKGTGIIPSPIGKVMSVLADTSRKKEWVANLVEARDLKEISQLERVEYNHTHAPWPCDDRDFVFHAKMTLDREKKTILIALRSCKDPGAPEDEDKAIRGELLESRYVLEALDESRTRLTIEIQADPKGSIPKWVVNFVQKNWPRRTIDGIRKQAAKADVAELTAVRDALFGTSVASVTSTAAK